MRGISVALTTLIFLAPLNDKSHFHSLIIGFRQKKVKKTKKKNNICLSSTVTDNVAQTIRFFLLPLNFDKKRQQVQVHFILILLTNILQ